MGSELWQFAVMLVVFAVAAFLWLQIVYLPGRTLERWQDQRRETDPGGRRPDEPTL